MEARNGGILNINAANWSNAGAINVVDAASTINLGGTFTSSGLGTFNNSAAGHLNLTGKLNNTTLTFGPGTGIMTVAGGTIQGGTVQENGANGLVFANNNSNALDNVTVRGVLDLSATNARTRVLNGLVLQTEAGGTPGVANVTGNNSAIFFDGAAVGWSQSFNNATINLGNAAGNQGNLTVERGGNLTLGAGAVVQGTGGIGTAIFVAGGGPDSLTNQGTISANLNARTLTIGGPSAASSVTTFTNSGILEARNGGTALVLAATITNISGTTLTGGTWRAVGNGSILNLRSGVITTNAADITLDTAGSVWRTQDPVSSVLTTLESSLTTNAAAGALRILGNRNYTTANALSNAGTLQLGGGTLTAASLTNSGQVFGFGTLANNVANTGTVRAAGGLLTASNGITGNTGTVQIDAGASLTLGATSTAATLTHNGTALALGANNITVSTAYTNASFGTGNTFNNRASVTGTGQILAAGATPGTAQTLSGDIVGGGTTSGNAVIAFGNVHVGDTVTRNYQIGNANAGGPSLSGAIQTSVNGGNLTDARLTGSGVTASNWGPLANGATTGPLAVTLTATSSGALTGQTIHIRNNFDNTNSQDLAIQGAGYNLAQATINNAGDFNFGSVLVGSGPITKTISLTNSQVAGAFSEALNANFGTVTNSGVGTVGTSGSIAGLLAGQNNNVSMVVTYTPTTAGAINASVQLLLASNGTAIGNGLGITALPDQLLALLGTVTGTAGNLAQASAATPNPVVFGNVRVGAVVAPVALSIGNVAVGPAEGLNGSIATGTSGLTASGSFSSLAAGANSTALSVGMTTGTAGSRNGTATITLASDGSFNSGVTTPLTPQTINVTGGVYQVAQPSVATSTINLANQRVGGSATQALNLTNTNISVAGFQEGLNANLSGASAGITAVGTVTNLAAGANNNSSLLLGVNTTSAGAKSGTATLNLASTGVGTSGLTDLPLTAQTINVSGSVFLVAQPSSAGECEPGQCARGRQPECGLECDEHAGGGGVPGRAQCGGRGDDGRGDGSGDGNEPGGEQQQQHWHRGGVEHECGRRAERDGDPRAAVERNGDERTVDAGPAELGADHHQWRGIQPGGGEYDAFAGDAGEPAGGWQREPGADGGQRGAGWIVYRSAQCELW